MYDLTILIPTFKRTKELILNLQILEKILEESKLLTRVFILICFDGSSNEHINHISKHLKQSKLKYELLRNVSNLGLEKTELNLVSNSKSSYAMLLGEDDYLNANLFKTEFEYLKKINDVGCIIPNYYGVDEHLNRIRSPKRRIKNDYFYEKGSLKELYKANQMSGLIFNCDGIVESYKKLVKTETVYPHLFFIGFNMIRYTTIEISRFPFMNTYVKTKSFSYTADGLLDDILRVYLSFDCNDKIKFDAIKHFLRKDMRRYCNPKTWLHPSNFKESVANKYELIPAKVKRMVINNFRLSYLLIPWFIFSHFWVRIFKGKKQ